MEESDPRIVVGEDIVYFWDGKENDLMRMDDVDMFVIDIDILEVAARKGGPGHLEVMALTSVNGAPYLRGLVTCDRDTVEEFSDALLKAPGHNFIAYRKDPAIWGRMIPRCIVNADHVTRKQAEEQMYKMTRTRVMVPDRDW
jgi:hypothetical protein